MNPNIMITGGRGYIGQHLAARFISSRHDVSVLSRNEYADRGALGGAKLVLGDVHRMESVDECCDVLIHAAASNGSESDIVTDYELTVHGTQRVLDWCVSHSVKTVIFFSTIQVYGALDGRNIADGDEMRPDNHYGLSHLVGEQMLEMYSRKHGLQGLVLRPTIVYGGMNAATPRWMLTPACFCVSVVSEGKIRLMSSGKQYRNYVPLQYVGEIVQTLVSKRSGLPKFDAYNVVGAETTTIAEVARLTSEIAASKFGIKAPVEVNEADTSNYLEFRLDGSKAAALVGVAPECRLREEIGNSLAALITREATKHAKVGKG